MNNQLVRDGVLEIRNVFVSKGEITTMNGMLVCDRLRIDLDPWAVENLLYHSSFPQSSEMYKRNKLMVEFGRAIIRFMASMYLYREHLVADVDELSRSSEWRQVEEAIHKQFDLEPFVYNAKGEEDKKHTDVASKITAELYYEGGVIKTYNFLLPILRRYLKAHGKDGKTLVQEYAQKYGLPFEYKILDKHGPNHEPIFVCQLTVGKENIVASACGKKNAEKAAAEKYMETKKTSSSRGFQHVSNYGTKCLTISEFQERQIRRLVSTIGIPDSILPIGMLVNAFTQKSFRVNGKIQPQNNGYLAIIGSLFMHVHECEYFLVNDGVLDELKTSSTHSLLRTENLSGFIPKDWEKSILASKSFFEMNEKGLENARVEVYKSLHGALGLQCLVLNRNDPYEISRDNAFECLNFCNCHKILDYRTKLQEIAAKYSLEYDISTEQTDAMPNNTYVYSTQITCSGGVWVEKASGFGASIKQSANNAAKKILETLSIHLNKDLQDNYFFSSVVDPEDIAADTPKVENLQDKMVMTTKTQTEVETQVAQYRQEVSFDKADNTLYIFKGVNDCSRKNHRTVTTVGVVTGVTGQTIKLQISYCETCKIYFMDYRKFCIYKDVYGVLLGNFVMVEGSACESGYENLASESILKICGYTVNQSDNLSEAKRHSILKFLIDQRIVSKYRILEYLQFFISNARNRHNMKLAVMKWEADLTWVHNYTSLISR